MPADATILNALLNPFVGAAAGTVIGVFWKFEDTASPELKQMITRWLKHQGTGASDGWANQLIVIFNKIFGNRHFSWKCFARSCVASIFAIFVMSAIWMIRLTWPQLMNFMAWAWYSSFTPIFVTITLGVNCLADYLSYMKTRIILGIMSNMHKLRYVFLFALTDTLATAGLFAIVFASICGGCAACCTVAGRSQATLLDAVISLLEDAPKLMQFGFYSGHRIETPGMGIFFYASLFVSMWAWLYALAAFITRFMASTLPRVMPKVVWFFDVDGHPIRSLGCIAGGIVFLVTLALNELR